MLRILFLSLLVFAGSLPALSEVDSGLLALVPSDAKLITSVDISQAKSWQFGQYIMSRINADDQGFARLIQETGFDPRRDVQDFVFASPGPSGEENSHKFTLLVRGSFDQDRIKKAAKNKGASIEKYQGIDLYLDVSGNRQNAFAFPETGVAVAGDVASVKQVITNRVRPTPRDPAVQQLIFGIGDNDAWFVSLMPGSYLGNRMSQQANMPAQAQALQSILQSSGGIRFGDMVQLSFDAIARSTKDAASLTDLIRFLGSMVQMQRQQDPRAGILASAVDGMSLKTERDAVHLSISIPEKNLEQLTELRSPSSGQGGRHWR